MNNPFFNKYDTPHETIPFDKIKMEHYEEAFLEGIKREDEEIEKIINNPETPTFENTIIYKDETKDDEYYDLLSKVSSAFFNLLSAETNDEMDALAQKIQPLLAKHSNDVTLNPKLFERIHYVFEHHRELTPEENTLLEKCHEGFVTNGALLDEEGKTKLRELSEKASLLGLQFSQNLLKENKSFSINITNESNLEGIPENIRNQAADEARAAGKQGWLFTLDMPSYSPFMTHSSRRELRKEMYMARNTECTHDNPENNLKICSDIINVRREIAQLLGFDTYADYVLRHRMAASISNVYKLFDDLITAYKPAALEDVAEIEKMAKEMEGEDFVLMPWDFSYYSHKLQLKKYNIDSEMLRPYFELSKVIDGVFGLATRLYGITFKENKDIPVYHPDVKAYEVFDKDGSYLAVLYADFHPRKGKRDGAWMTEYQGQWITRKGENVRPHVSVVMNLTKPTADKPALLTLGEVSTFLHEFGHSLHGMFANTRFESLSGTNVWWDFVELPSQFMENYAVEKDFLNTFARHHETGEPIPEDLIDRIIKSRNYLAGYSCLRQVSFGLLDMAYYTKKDKFDEDIIKFEKEAWKDAIVTRQLPDTCMTVQFGHIMSGGYAAGYYSYKWAEVLDADAFGVFRKHGIFNRVIAQRFRDNILSKGGTEHPMTLYKRFKGSEPTIDALLERNGIKKN